MVFVKSKGSADRFGGQADRLDWVIGSNRIGYGLVPIGWIGFLGLTDRLDIKPVSWMAR